MIRLCSGVARPLATAAARQALKTGGIGAEELDCIIVATSTPDMILPATACMVQKNIGATRAVAFDLNAVCSSLVFGVETADNFIKPWVLRGKSKLHPLLALLSVLGGVQALGPLGILVGPMIVVFLQTLLNILHRELTGTDRLRPADAS